jgi:dGTP triphosphohydrolase
MNMTIDAVQDRAKSLKGCLGHLRTIAKDARRRDAEDEDVLPIDLFISDKMKILSSKGWRTLADKTQVFTWPENCLMRTRQTHVAEVVAIATGLGNMLGLNTHLIEAAAFGHDIGHVPLGHQGEMWMAQAMGKPHFCHEVMGPIIVQKIERKGKGLNLTFQTIEAMMCHSGDKAYDGMTQEAWVLRYADKIAYLFADYNDIVIRSNYPVSNELKDIIRSFGENQRQRATTAMAGLVAESYELGKVSFEHSELGKNFTKLRKMMYEIYPRVTQQNVGDIMGPVLEFLVSLNIGDPFLLLALMTDKDLQLVASTRMKDMNLFNRTALKEIAPYLTEIGPIDLCNPYLDW